MAQGMTLNDFLAKEMAQGVTLSDFFGERNGLGCNPE
jgi:hypothetical protein